eukprot:SAG11_NODE_832_length_6948_cov_10.083662_4_plen_39_part_00
MHARHMKLDVVVASSIVHDLVLNVLHAIYRVNSMILSE